MLHLLPSLFLWVHALNIEGERICTDLNYCDKTISDARGDRCNSIWGMDEEGEVNSESAWKTSGVPGPWLMVAILQHGRYHSRS
jgi:hypothetical protein